MSRECDISSTQVLIALFYWAELSSYKLIIWILGKEQVWVIPIKYKSFKLVLKLVWVDPNLFCMDVLVTSGISQISRISAYFKLYFIINSSNSTRTLHFCAFTWRWGCILVCRRYNGFGTTRANKYISHSVLIYIVRILLAFTTS